MPSQGDKKVERLPSYGGQAVLEGVMMRGTKTSTVAVRSPDQTIVYESKPLGRLYRSPVMKLPFLRGLLMLWDSIALGIQALTFSADVQLGEDEKIEGAPLIVTMLISFSFAIALFFLLPAGAAYLFESWFSLSNALANTIEGFIRLGLLVGYVWGIGFMADIRRVYGYHGAEHMTINAFEDGAPLSVESVAKYPREHPRCGTAFLLTVVLFSILLFSLLGPMPLWARLLSRLALLPILAALAYEYIRFSSRFGDNPLGRFLLAPNLALQRVTTRIPDEGMLEVAIAAFETMRRNEEQAEN